MKRTVTPAILPVDCVQKPNEAIEIDVHTKAVIRRCLLTARQPQVIANHAAPPIELVPTILFEIDPDNPKHKRKFAIVPMGKTIESISHLEYRGEFLYPDGSIFFLYEEIDAPADVVALAMKTFQER